MEKYPFMTLIMITISLISLIRNNALLIVILVYDNFLLTAFITLSAILLLIIAIIGVLMKQKWGIALVLLNVFSMWCYFSNFYVLELQELY